MKGKKRQQRTQSKHRLRIVGGGAEGRKLFVDAANPRIQHDLCRCSDEEVYYDSEEARVADANRPPVICGTCQKRKLRVVSTLGESGTKAARERARQYLNNGIVPLDGLLK